MDIHWNIEQLDQDGSLDPAADECLLHIEGKIRCDGQPAGSLDAYYLFVEDPESAGAFMDFWDLDATTCSLYEEIIAPDRSDFRDPITDFLIMTPGILYIHSIALYPPFRRRGLGREVMRELVRNFADDRVGMVLLNAQPLQHLPHGYDHFADEVRDLPWNSPDGDLARLVSHFLTWDMQILPGTRYLLAAPEYMIDGPPNDWYPGLLGDH
jgi:GNAT superfamily N-acetyltransferase